MLTGTLALISTPNPKPDRFQALGRSPRLHLCAFASDSSERRHAGSALRRALYLPYISALSPLYLPYISPISPLEGSALRRALAAETRTFVDISELSDAEAP